MASLQVRELPDALYHKLQKLADSEHRSIAQQAVILLAQALSVSLSNTHRRKNVLSALATNTAPKQKKYTAADKLVREDRDR